MDMTEPREKKNYFDKLKQKWGLTSNVQVVIVLIVFTLAGSSIVITKPYYKQFLGLNDNTNFFLSVLMIFIIYQFHLIIIGTIFGQFKFFLGKIKGMMMGIFKLLILPYSLLAKSRAKQ